MKIGMIFPGYGSQFVGMIKDLYDEHRIIQEYFEEAAQCLDKNFVKLCFASSDNELAALENAYTTIFLVSSALGALLKERSIMPDIVAGYNIGEFSALHTVNGMSFPDGLYILSKYAQLYQSLLDSDEYLATLCIDASKTELLAWCNQASFDDKRASIAVEYDQATYIVMGHAAVMEPVGQQASDAGVKVEPASLGLGLHSSLMDGVVENIKMYLEKIDCKDLLCPIITNADAMPITSCHEVQSSIIKQMHSTIRWYDIIENFSDCTHIIMVGPGQTLVNQIRTRYPAIECLTLNNKEDLAMILEKFQAPTETIEIIEIEQDEEYSE